MDGFINAIYLYDDKIVITFNYKDGAKTITLDEVNGSDLAVCGAPKFSAKSVGFGGFFCLAGNRMSDEENVDNRRTRKSERIEVGEKRTCRGRRTRRAALKLNTG